MKKFSYIISSGVIVIFFSFLIFLLLYFYGKSSQKSKPIIKLEISELSDMPLSSEILISEKRQSSSSAVVLESESVGFSDNSKILTPLPDFLSSEVLPILVTGNDSDGIISNYISENLSDESVLSDAPSVHSSGDGITDAMDIDHFIDERPNQSKVGAHNEKNAIPIAENHSIWRIVGAKTESAIVYNNITRETRTVYVGDTISGIGKIKSIEAVNGKWTVIGSNKSIGQ